jgi:hypothetical protein
MEGELTSVWALAALWLALHASLLSIWFRISTTLSEIVVGTVAQLIIGAVVGHAILGTDESWVKFLSGLGAIVLTFLALVRRLRTLTFGLLTPFYFIRAGSFVSIPSLVAAPTAFLFFLLVKIATKIAGVYPVTKRFAAPDREAMYTTLLMSTGADLRDHLLAVRIVARHHQPGAVFGVGGGRHRQRGHSDADCQCILSSAASFAAIRTRCGDGGRAGGARFRSGGVNLAAPRGLEHCAVQSAINFGAHPNLRHIFALSALDEFARRANHYAAQNSPVQPPAQKYFAFPEMQIRCRKSCLVPTRGAYRGRHGRGARDAMDAAASHDGWRLPRSAKACGPGTPTLVPSLRMMICRRRGLSSPVPRGERAISCNTIVQGMPACFGVPVVTAACVSCCRRAMGAACTRHSLRPLYDEGHI